MTALSKYRLHLFEKNGYMYKKSQQNKIWNLQFLKQLHLKPEEKITF